MKETPEGFHPRNIPIYDPKNPPQGPDPIMMWDDYAQSYEVWKDGKMVAICNFDSPTLQLWWNDMQITYFGGSDKP